VKRICLASRSACVIETGRKIRREEINRVLFRGRAREEKNELDGDDVARCYRKSGSLRWQASDCRPFLRDGWIANPKCGTAQLSPPSYTRVAYLPYSCPFRVVFHIFHLVPV
jgi:hypothetical protein